MAKIKDTIYNFKGQPSLYRTETGEFVDTRGRYVGFLDGKAVYDFNGTQRGWFEAGVLRDPLSNCVGFIEGATSSALPLLPDVTQRGLPRVQRQPPKRPACESELKKARPEDELSQFDPISLFQVVYK
ncbi:MAG: hypothetical protein HYW48_07295 [Deltaproteobacteria bacterium]|nr:hypothetical protein [Deltaproteobacteria bacterium]